MNLGLYPKNSGQNMHSLTKYAHIFLLCEMRSNKVTVLCVFLSKPQKIRNLRENILMHKKSTYLFITFGEYLETK